MNDNAVFPTRDSRWDAWSIDSITSFQACAASIRFDERISHDVKQRYEVIKKLLVYSYYEYDFLDVALHESVLTFEMALAQRYQEVMGVPPKQKKMPDWNLGLYDLIEWGASQSLFEDDASVIHRLREIRNAVAHPEQYQLYGTMAFDIPARVAQIINELYDDVEIRKERKQTELEINENFNNIEATGALLEIDDKRYLIFLASLLHYENRLESKAYHFAFWPIFDPSKCSKEKCDVGEPIVISCTKHSANGFEHYLSHRSRIKATLKKIENQVDIKKYREWLEFFRGFNEAPIQFHIKVTIGELRAKVKRQYLEKRLE
jgi:hypothetical protein